MVRYRPQLDSLSSLPNAFSHPFSTPFHPFLPSSLFPFFPNTIPTFAGSSNVGSNVPGAGSKPSSKNYSKS